MNLLVSTGYNVVRGLAVVCGQLEWLAVKVADNHPCLASYIQAGEDIYVRLLESKLDIDLTHRHIHKSKGTAIWIKHLK